MNAINISKVMLAGLGAAVCYGQAWATPASVTSFTAPSTVWVGQSFNSSVSCADPDGDLSGSALRWQGIGLVAWWPSAGYSDSQTATLTAPSTTGTFNLRAEAIDTNLEGMATDWKTITVSNTPASMSWAQGYNNDFTIRHETVTFSVSDGGTQTGSVTSYDDHTGAFGWSYSASQLNGGLGYALWRRTDTEWGHSSGANYQNTRLYIVQYNSKTHSWGSAYQIVLYQGGEVNTTYPYYYTITFTSLTATSVQWTVSKYNSGTSALISTTNSSYTIPPI